MCDLVYTCLPPQACALQTRDWARVVTAWPWGDVNQLGTTKQGGISLRRKLGTTKQGNITRLGTTKLGGISLNYDTPLGHLICVGVLCVKSVFVTQVTLRTQTIKCTL